MFDGKGPYIETTEDGEKIIHLRQELLTNEKPKELTLKTHLLNSSVQGCQKNKGTIQQQTNIETFEKLSNTDEFCDLFGLDKNNKIIEILVNQLTNVNFSSESHIKDRVNSYIPPIEENKRELLTRFLTIQHKIYFQEHTSYDLADEMGAFFLSMDAMLGVSCQSAKDRTGLTCDRLSYGYAIRQQEEFYDPDQLKLTPKGEQEYKTKMKETMRGKYISAAIINQNNPIQRGHLKIDPTATDTSISSAIRTQNIIHLTIYMKFFPHLNKQPEGERGFPKNHSCVLL